MPSLGSVSDQWCCEMLVALSMTHFQSLMTQLASIAPSGEEMNHMAHLYVLGQYNWSLVLHAVMLVLMVQQKACWMALYCMHLYYQYYLKKKGILSNHSLWWLIFKTTGPGSFNSILLCFNLFCLVEISRIITSKKNGTFLTNRILKDSDSIAMNIFC